MILSHKTVSPKANHGSGQIARQAWSPEPMQLDDWENEGGATPPAATAGEGAALLATIERSLRSAARHTLMTVRSRPVAALTAAFALGLVAGGGLRYLKSGRLLMSLAAKPLLALASGVLLKK